MGPEILGALEDFQEEATKGVQKTSEELPMFNAKLKKDLTDRLIEVFEHYKTGTNLTKFEYLIDEEIFPLISKAGLKNINGKCEDYLRAVKEFVEGLNPQQEQEQEQEFTTEQEKINKPMEKFYGFSEEIKTRNTDFSDLFSEVKHLLIRNLSLDHDNLDLQKEVTRIVARIQETAEEYHSGQYNELIASGKKKADEIYMIYNQLLAQKAAGQTEETLLEARGNPFY